MTQRWRRETEAGPAGEELPRARALTLRAKRPPYAAGSYPSFATAFSSAASTLAAPEGKGRGIEPCWALFYARSDAAAPSHAITSSHNESMPFRLGDCKWAVL